MKKVPFTPFQLVLTVVNTAALMFCMGCDCFVLIVGMTAGRTKPYVVGLMLAGALGVEWAKKAIIIFAPVVFVLAAIVYFILSGRIGLDDFSDSDGEE